MSIRLTVTLALALIAPACVTSPNWGDEPSRRDPLDFTGMASRANAPILVQAYNFQTNEFDTVGRTVSTSTRLATSPDLYGWLAHTVRLADRYWGPPCEWHAMANLRVLEVNTDGTTSELATFDHAGEDCLNEHLADGEHPVVAGNACRFPNPRIVLFAPAQCPIPAATDATGPQLTIRLTDPSRVWQASTGGADQNVSSISRTSVLTATAMVRDRESAAAQVRLIADLNVSCRTSTGVTSLIPRGFVETRTQTVVTTAPAEIGLDALRAINVATLVSSCPVGTTFVRLDATILADGRNGVGTSGTSPRLRFTVM